MKFKKAVLAICGVLAVSFAGMGTAFAVRAAAQDATRRETEAAFPSYIYAGETFTPPACTLTYRGEEKEGEALLILPDGSAKQQSSYYLETPGKYTVRYTADFGGFPVQEEKSFLVVDRLFSSDGAYDTYYGTASRGDYEAPARPGAVVTLGKGETWTYHKPIDFNGRTRAEDFLSFYVLPEKIGFSDAREVTFILTDTADPDNKVTITCYSHITYENWVIWSTYVRAGATGQLQAGWEGSKLHLGDKWGAGFGFSMHGTPQAGTYATQKLSLQMDYENRTLYGNRTTNPIIKLDDPAVFENLWGGFQNGTAYLSVRFGLFNSASATIVLENVYEENFSDYETAKVYDDAPPVLTVEETEETLPAAVVGSPYKLYPARAEDASAVTLTRRVFLNYGADTQAECTVEGGAFTPFREGEYAVEYRAEDRFGNVSTKVYFVEAGPRAVPFRATVSDMGTSGNAGEELSLGNLTVEGAIGSYTVSTVAVLNGETFAVGETFRPLYAGTYTVRRIVRDYIGETTAEYEVNVTKGNVVKILERPFLPARMIVGGRYVLPTVKGVDFSSGAPVEIPAAVSVSAGAGSLAGGMFIPAKAGEAEIVYTASANGATDTLTLPVTLIDVGYGSELHLENYFTGLKTEVSEAAVGLVAESDGAAHFIKSVDAGEFALEFDVDPILHNFGKLTLTLWDSENAGISLTLAFLRNTAGYCKVSIDGGEPLLTQSSWNGNGKDFVVQYLSSSGMLSVGDVVKTAIKPYFFPSGRVDFALAFEEVEGLSKVSVSRVNNQNMGNIGRDVVNPQILTMGKVAASYLLGDAVTLPAAVVTDVVDPYVTASLTVRTPSGKILVTDSGRSLENEDPTREYTFTANEYGQYNATVTAIDGSGRRYVLRYAVNVNDVTPPEISFPFLPAVSGKVGARVALPKATATDDRDGEIALFVYLIRPDFVQVPLYAHEKDAEGNFKTDENGNPVLTYYTGFVPTAAGRYVVQYYAADSAGNVTVRAFTVTVE